MSSTSGNAKSLFALAVLIFLTACGGRAVNKKTAQDLILKSQPQTLRKEDVLIDSVTQAGSRDAIVETRMHLAFRFEKIRGDWIVKEVRLGEGPWYSVEEISSAMREAQVATTRKLLDQIASAAALYWKKNGTIPDFKDYVSLSDVLSPVYLNPLIRLDAWEHPLAAYRLDSNTLRLVSSGPDGVQGTGDDIELTRHFQ